MFGAQVLGDSQGTLPSGGLPPGVCCSPGQWARVCISWGVGGGGWLVFGFAAGS